MGGPILISAPHTLPVDRIDDDGVWKSLHKRERYAAEITAKLAQELRSYLGINASFIFWDPRAKYHSHNLDPNKLSQQNLEKSPFHLAIHYFCEHFRSQNVPIMHIDLHGKLDRKTDLNMDIGTQAMRK